MFDTEVPVGEDGFDVVFTGDAFDGDEEALGENFLGGDPDLPVHGCPQEDDVVTFLAIGFIDAEVFSVDESGGEVGIGIVDDEIDEGDGNGEVGADFVDGFID